MRSTIELWNGQPSEDKCKHCGNPYFPTMVCPKCGYKTNVTNVCRRCMVNLQLTGYETHWCETRKKSITRKIKNYVNQGTIWEKPKNDSTN